MNVPWYIYNVTCHTFVYVASTSVSERRDDDGLQNTNKHK